MGDLNIEVQRLLEANVPEAEIGKFIQEYSTGSSDIETSEDRYEPPAKSPGFIGTAMEPGDIESAKRVASEVYRPAFEMGGMTVGATVGSGAGPVGAVAGGAGGYAIGTTIADRLDEFLNLVEPMDTKKAFKKAGYDIATGTAYEAGGVLIGSGVEGLGGLFRKIKELFPSLSNKGILTKARDILAKVRAEEGQMAKTTQETEKLIERTGIKTEPTFAQKTGSTKAAAHEQAVSAKDKEIMGILKGQDANINKEVMESLEAKFAEQGAIEDIISGVREHVGKLVKSTDLAKAKSASDVAKIVTGRKTQEIGENTIQILKEAKTFEKTQIVDRAYAKIPSGVKLKPDDMIDSSAKVIADYKLRGGGKDSLPSSILKEIRRRVKEGSVKLPNGKLRPEHLKFEGLQDLSNLIGEEMRDSLRGIQPNLKLYRRLKMLKTGVDNSLDQMLRSGDDAVVDAYVTAKRAYLNYHLKYKSGVVGDVLQSGRQASGLKIAYSAVPERFFSTGKMDTADDLVRALGKKNATTAIDDFAGRDMLNASLKNGELNANTANVWLRKNKDILDKYGLYDKYNTMIKNKEVSDALVSQMENYTKTVANKVLDVDINKVIPNLFSGAASKNSLITARNLMNAPGIKGNKLAEEGIRNGFKDFFKESIEVSGVDTLGNPILSIAKAKKFLINYRSAIKELYKNDPKKAQALFDYHKVLEMLGRNKIITYSGGSTTAEKAAGSFSGVGTNIAQFVAVQHGAGWKFSVLKNLWKSIFGGPGRYSTKQVEALLSKAVYDPNVAQTIMEATKTMHNRTSFDKRMTQHLMAISLYATNKTKDMIIEEFK